MTEEPKEATEGPKEAIKLCFESLKQIATLSSGAIVVIGTFFKNVFPTASDGTLQITLASTFLIAASIVFFFFSLAVSAIAMDSNVVLMKDVEERRSSLGRVYTRGFIRRALARVLIARYKPLDEVTERATAAALFLFSTGIVCFGLAVLFALPWSASPALTNT